MRKPSLNSQQSFTLSVIASVTLGLLTGCGNPAELVVRKLFRPSPDTDVTASARYNFSSFADTAWKTKGKTAITDIKRYTGAHDIVLLLPKHFDASAPDFTTVHNMQMIAVLPPGARIKIDRLTKDNGAWGGLMVTATIRSGTNLYKNVRLEELLLGNNAFISRGPTTSTNWEVNPDFLEKQ